MKYLFSLMALMLSVLCSFTVANAEEAVIPNRILVTNTNNNYSGYVIDNVKDIRFAYVEGEVLAKVDIFEIELDRIVLSITRTPACKTYRIDLVPQTVANSFNEVSAISYVERYGTEPYDVDFTQGEMTDINLSPGAEYSIITVGYDEYGIASGVEMTPFKTPSPDIVGDPHVDVTFVSATTNSFTLTFTPNKDVYQYYLCSFEAGTVEEYFAVFGPMMGFASINEMVVGFSMGNYYISKETITFDDYDPGTYDIVIVMVDKNGNYAPYEIYTASTYISGGKGEARVKVEIGDYYGDDWGDGDITPTLGVYYEPNDQTYRYRAIVYLASDVDKYGMEAIIDDVKSDPPMPGALGWYIYEDYYNEYRVQPSTPIVVVAAGQNADLEWGEATVLYYTTPDVCPGYNRSLARSIGQEEIKTRHQIKDKAVLKGAKAPKQNKVKGIKIHE